MRQVQRRAEPFAQRQWHRLDFADDLRYVGQRRRGELGERLRVFRYAKALGSSSTTTDSRAIKPAKRRTSAEVDGVSAWVKSDLGKLAFGQSADVTLGRAAGGSLAAEAACLSVSGAIQVGQT